MTKYKILYAEDDQTLAYLTKDNLEQHHYDVVHIADGKLCYAVDFNGAKYLLENNLSQLEEQLQPDNFYRINRHLLINIEAVKKVHTWLGGRLNVEMPFTTTAETVVSRERVNGFKEWLGR